MAAERSNPMSKERWLHSRRRAERSYSTFKVRRGGGEEISHVQGKEQWLRFAGTAMKRYPHVQGKRNPSKMVGTEREDRRGDRLNYKHRQLANLITWTTALSNSMKLSHALWGNPRRAGHGGEV